MGRFGLLVLMAGARLLAQTACQDSKAFLPCDVVFELTEAEVRANPEPWKSLKLTAEVKSPRFRTFNAEAFWDGGAKLVIRFTPTEAGNWELLLASSVARWDKQQVKVTAGESEAAGFIARSNVHHWRWTGTQKAHFWHGMDVWDLPGAANETLDLVRVNKATHVRTQMEIVWPPQPQKMRALEEKILGLNKDGIVVDLVLAGAKGDMTRALPDAAARERYFRYLLARLAPLNVTWELVKDWETYVNPRALLKEVGGLVKRFDPYDHPRSAYPMGSTSAFVKDGWMTHLLVNAEEPNIAAVEHQTYPLPVISVSRKSDPKIMWRAVFSGSYAGSNANAGLYEVLTKTRYWELEPFFDVSNGICLALDGTEYLVLMERPGIVEVEVEKHSYDTAWIRLQNGERVPQKDFKSEHFIGEPPDKAGIWLLHLSREGRKEGMLKSYKFESQPMLMQDIETDPKRVPFTININDNADLVAGKSVPFEVKITKDSRATRFMKYLITADVPTEFEGMRVASTSEKGTLNLPAELATKFPAVLNLKVTGMNANGKVYSLDRVVRLIR